MGAPCSGKSTYIKERANGQDIIIDMDRIALALAVEGTAPFEYSDAIKAIARQARSAIVKAALLTAQGERRLGLWIVHTDPSPKDRLMYRAMNAKFVELDPGKKVCLERLKERPLANRKLADKIIRDYYAKRTLRNVASTMADSSSTPTD